MVFSLLNIVYNSGRKNKYYEKIDSRVEYFIGIDKMQVVALSGKIVIATSKQWKTFNPNASLVSASTSISGVTLL